MKKLILSFSFFLLIGFSIVASADAVIEEYGAPITVEKDVYTVRDPNYYYYEGHRCYTKERPDLGVNFLGLHAGIGDSRKIYCYPYP